MKVKFAGHILTIDPTLGEAVINRLRDLGIEEGQYIQCLQQGKGNRPAIYRIGDSVFTLDQNIAHGISINEEQTV